MVLKGESYRMYESRVAELMEETATNAPTNEFVQAGLDAVAVDVFPHRALFFQKRWMQNGMKKPRSMTTRQTVAAIVKINNALPNFPGSQESDKFSESELLQIVEWMVPHEFRAKFDEKGYIPSDHDRKRFILESEIVERSQELRNVGSKRFKRFDSDDEGSHHRRGKRGGTREHRRKGKNQKGKARDAIQNKREKSQQYYCSHHGKNDTHRDAGCWVLHPELKPNFQMKADPNSKRSLAKEIHCLARIEKTSDLAAVNKRILQLKELKTSFEKGHKAESKEPPKSDTSSCSNDSLRFIQSVRMVNLTEHIP